MCFSKSVKEPEVFHFLQPHSLCRNRTRTKMHGYEIIWHPIHLASFIAGDPHFFSLLAYSFIYLPAHPSDHPLECWPCSKRYKCYSFFILIEINTVTSGLTILLLQVVPFQEISELSNHLLEETVLPVWFLYHAEWMTSLDLLPRLILLPEILRRQNKITSITSVSFCMGLFLKQTQKTTQK